MLKASDEATRSTLKNQAYEDLATSIHIHPDNKHDAAQDEDFAPLFDEPRFKDLVR